MAKTSLLDSILGRPSQSYASPGSSGAMTRDEAYRGGSEYSAPHSARPYTTRPSSRSGMPPRSGMSEAGAYKQRHRASSSMGYAPDTALPDAHALVPDMNTVNPFSRWWENRGLMEKRPTMDVTSEPGGPFSDRWRREVASHEARSEASGPMRYAGQRSRTGKHISRSASSMGYAQQPALRQDRRSVSSQGMRDASEWHSFMRTFEQRVSSASDQRLDVALPTEEAPMDTSQLGIALTQDPYDTPQRASPYAQRVAPSSMARSPMPTRRDSQRLTSPAPPSRRNSALQAPPTTTSAPMLEEPTDEELVQLSWNASLYFNEQGAIDASPVKTGAAQRTSPRNAMPPAPPASEMPASRPSVRIQSGPTSTSMPRSQTFHTAPSSGLKQPKEFDVGGSMRRRVEGLLRPLQEHRVSTISVSDSLLHDLDPSVAAWATTGTSDVGHTEPAERATTPRTSRHFEAPKTPSGKDTFSAPSTTPSRRILDRPRQRGPRPTAMGGIEIAHGSLPAPSPGHTPRRSVSEQTYARHASPVPPVPKIKTSITPLQPPVATSSNPHGPTPVYTSDPLAHRDQGYVTLADTLNEPNPSSDWDPIDRIPPMTTTRQPATGTSPAPPSRADVRFSTYTPSEHVSELQHYLPLIHGDEVDRASSMRHSRSLSHSALPPSSLPPSTSQPRRISSHDIRASQALQNVHASEASHKGLPPVDVTPAPAPALYDGQPSHTEALPALSYLQATYPPSTTPQTVFEHSPTLPTSMPESADAYAASWPTERTMPQPPSKPEPPIPPKPPTMPVMPSKPEMPSMSSKPEMPVMPSMPSMPEMPTMPSMPLMPSKPEMPTMPSKPEMPAMPSMPSLPSKPEMPTMPSMPSIPSKPEMPTMPSMPSIPSKPEMPSPTYPTYQQQQPVYAAYEASMTIPASQSMPPFKPAVAVPAKPTPPVPPLMPAPPSVPTLAPLDTTKQPAFSGQTSPSLSPSPSLRTRSPLSPRVHMGPVPTHPTLPPPRAELVLSPRDRDQGSSAASMYRMRGASSPDRQHLHPGTWTDVGSVSPSVWRDNQSGHLSPEPGRRRMPDSDAMSATSYQPMQASSVLGGTREPSPAASLSTAAAQSSVMMKQAPLGASTNQYLGLGATAGAAAQESSSALTMPGGGAESIPPSVTGQSMSVSARVTEQMLRRRATMVTVNVISRGPTAQPTSGNLARVKSEESASGSIVLASNTPPPHKVSSKSLIVQVMAVAIDDVDRAIVNEKLRSETPGTFVPGRSFCGRIVECGLSVKKLRPGDLVFGLQDLRKCGALAEFMTVDQEYVAPAPDSRRLTAEQIAALPATGVMVHQIVQHHCMVLPKGSRVLILNAHDNIGLLAMQETSRLGLVIVAHVPDTAADGVSICRANGAVEVISGDALWAINMLHESSFALIIDTIGGRNIYDACRRILANHGQFVTCFGDGHAVPNPTHRSHLRSLRRSFFRKDRKAIGYEWIGIDASTDYRAALEAIKSAAQRGAITPRIQSVIPLDDAPRIFMETSSFSGGVAVVRVS